MHRLSIKLILTFCFVFSLSALACYPDDDFISVDSPKDRVSEESQDDVQTILPPDSSFDQILDSSTATFRFEMLRQLPLKLRVIQHLGDNESKNTDTAVVSVFEGQSKKLIYRGAIGEKLGITELDEEITIHIDWKSLEIRIHGDHLAERIISVTDLQSLASINRDTHIAVTPWSNNLDDGDGDLIPDQYDRAPTNPSVSFAIQSPPDGVYAAVYEDLYPQLGDYDFNDWVAHYAITQERNAQNQITAISGHVKSVARCAGHDHAFRIGLAAGEEGLAYTLNQTTGSHTTSTTGTVTSTRRIDVEVFASTKAAFGNTGRCDNGRLDIASVNGLTGTFSLAFATPVDASLVMPLPLDPYIVDKSSGHDIHMIGASSIPGSNNPSGTTFADSNGFPWVMVVPRMWQHPLEGVHTSQAYPQFTDWVGSNGVTSSDWYNFPLCEKVYWFPGTEPGADLPIINRMKPSPNGINLDLYVDRPKPNVSRLDFHISRAQWADPTAIDPSHVTMELVTIQGSQLWSSCNCEECHYTIPLGTSEAIAVQLEKFESPGVFTGETSVFLNIAATLNRIASLVPLVQALPFTGNQIRMHDAIATYSPLVQSAQSDPATWQTRGLSVRFTQDLTGNPIREDSQELENVQSSDQLSYLRRVNRTTGKVLLNDFTTLPSVSSGVYTFNDGPSLALPVASDYTLPVVTNPTTVPIVSGAYLYLIGGYTSITPNLVTTSVVQHAKINSNTGELGSFSTASLQIPGQYIARMVASVNGYIYVAGGLSGIENTNSVPTDALYIAKPDPVTGIISTWTSGRSLPVPLAYSISFAQGNYLYLIGGLIQSSPGAQISPSDAMYRTELDPATGQVGEWSYIGDLPVDYGELAHYFYDPYRSALYLIEPTGTGTFNTWQGKETPIGLDFAKTATDYTIPPTIFARQLQMIGPDRYVALNSGTAEAYLGRMPLAGLRALELESIGSMGQSRTNAYLTTFGPYAYALGGFVSTEICSLTECTTEITVVGDVEWANLGLQCEILSLDVQEHFFLGGAAPYSTNLTWDSACPSINSLKYMVRLFSDAYGVQSVPGWPKQTTSLNVATEALPVGTYFWCVEISGYMPCGSLPLTNSFIVYDSTLALPEASIMIEALASAYYGWPWKSPVLDPESIPPDYIFPNIIDNVDHDTVAIFLHTIEMLDQQRYALDFVECNQGCENASNCESLTQIINERWPAGIRLNLSNTIHIANLLRRSLDSLDNNTMFYAHPALSLVANSVLGSTLYQQYQQYQNYELSTSPGQCQDMYQLESTLGKVDIMLALFMIERLDSSGGLICPCQPPCPCFCYIAE